MSSSEALPGPPCGTAGTGGARVLGIDVPAVLLESWRRWWSPQLQPFPVGGLESGRTSCRPFREVSPSPEVRDSFFLYGGTWDWWYEEEFLALPPEVQRRLRCARRRVMSPKPSPPWPSTVTPDDDSALLAWVTAGAARSRHAEVAEEQWHRAATVLPRARELAGTFPVTGSGANCFGTVIAAADRSADDGRWTQVEEFARWLAAATRPVRGTVEDDRPGTVLVWREHGALAHAAVTLGDGWALVKPSQSWSSPRLVQPVRELILSWRYPGTRLERHRLVRRPGDRLSSRDTEDIDLELSPLRLEEPGPLSN